MSAVYVKDVEASSALANITGDAPRAGIATDAAMASATTVTAGFFQAAILWSLKTPLASIIVNIIHPLLYDTAAGCVAVIASLADLGAEYTQQKY